jgi:hypothetical protein
LGHVIAISGLDRALRLAGALACALALGGCGGVEFEGKVFDYMGMSGDRQKADVRMSERAPLLLPPNPKALPPPGQGTSVAAARADWPNDPERVRKRVVEEQQAKASAEEAKADPINPYAGKPTLLDKWFGKSKTVEEPIADVPEPDPSDAPPQQDVATSTPHGLKPHVPDAPLPGEDLSKATPQTPSSYSKQGQRPVF